MGIVLRENEWAEKMIQSKTLGNKPSETLRRVARYYLDNGYKNKRDIKNKLEIFLIQCDPLASLPKWDSSIEYAINSAFKYNAIYIENIQITKSEIEKINSLTGIQLRRLAFTLLCLAKYWKIVCNDMDYWVTNKDSEIMSMANINTSIKRQCVMYGVLKDLGLIRFSKKIDNTNVKVCFVDDESDVVLNISDFRNLGYQYMKFYYNDHKRNPYFECENCGITVRYTDPKNGRKQKFCKSCATEIAIQQRVSGIMHY